EVPTITQDERQLLLDSASCLNAWVDSNAILAPTGTDGFDSRVTWDEILVPLRWRRVVKNFGEVALWQSPQRTKPGYCAITGIGFDRNLLYDIRTGRAYTKFGAFGSFYFDGNFEKARSARLRSARTSRWETPQGEHRLNSVRQTQPLVSCI